MMDQRFYSQRGRVGWVEAIVGCMFSGKTEELIRQMRRAQIARQTTQLFKPRIDSRYSSTHVASHNKNTMVATIVDNTNDILDQLDPATSVVGIDEGQFFSPQIVEIATTLAEAGKRVIIAGLDTDWKGRPFGPMPQLLAVAEIVNKQYAICMVCGEAATRTQRLISASSDILVGSSDAYEARCRLHFEPHVHLPLITDKGLPASEPF